jgi:hypothetical protein
MTGDKTSATDQDDIPIYPDFVPTKVTKKLIYKIENEDTTSDGEMNIC